MTQEEKVLAYIEEHGSITSMEAFLHLHITRLAAVIFNLKAKGHRIKSVTRKKTENGLTMWWAEYTLEEPPTDGAVDGSKRATVDNPVTLRG